MDGMDASPHRGSGRSANRNRAVGPIETDALRFKSLQSGEMDVVGNVHVRLPLVHTKHEQIRPILAPWLVAGLYRLHHPSWLGPVLDWSSGAERMVSDFFAALSTVELRACRSVPQSTRSLAVQSAS